MTLEQSASPHPEFGSRIELRDVLARAKADLDAGHQLQRRAPTHARQHVRIIDIRFFEDSNYAAVLMRLVDKDGQDSVYEDMDNGTLEPHRKRPTQGNRVTAHFVIDLNGTSLGNSIKYPAVLEVVSGISVTLVTQRMCTVGSRYLYNGLMGVERREVSFHATYKLHPFVERTIREELMEGVLSGFALVHAEPLGAGYDEERLVKTEKRILEIKVVADDVRTRLDDILAAVQLRAQREGYELVRAEYETSDGRSASQKIDIARQNALEDLVSKVTLITLDEDLHPDQVTVTEGLATRMISALR